MLEGHNMNYPNGMKKSRTTPSRNRSHSNRGMTLEEDINLTNKYDLAHNKVIIHKKQTPIQNENDIFQNKIAAVITEAYFQQATTTDYNRLYLQTYLDFEAKETKNKTSFPLANFHEHQIKHMASILEHGGICFIIIRFTMHDETYLFQAKDLLPYWKDQFVGGRKSIPYQEINEKGYLIPFKYQARVDYLGVLDQIYF